MYALPNKTQHKLIVKVRGGISQKVDNFYSPTQASINSNEISSEISSHSRNELQSKLSLLDDAGFNAELSHMPQPVFHSISLNGNKQRSSIQQHKVPKQYITPEHNEMIQYVQRSWKGVERDYKKSVNNFINHIDLNSSSCSKLEQQKRVATASGSAKKKTATISTPLLLSGSYHHTSSLAKEGDRKQDTFRPFDLEAFWGNRILKRLTSDI